MFMRGERKAPKGGPLDVSSRANGLDFIRTKAQTVAQMIGDRSKQAYQSQVDAQRRACKRQRLALKVLPVEILREIFDHLEYYDIRTLVFVSQNISSIAVKHLYSDPHITSVYRCRLLVSSLRKNHQFQDMVTTLNLSAFGNDNSALFKDWLYSMRGSTSQPLNPLATRTLPAGQVIHLVTMCTNLITVDLSGLPWPTDYFIKGAQNMRFVSDCVQSYGWQQHQVTVCSPKDLFTQLAALSNLNSLTLRKTTWITKQLVRDLLHENTSITWIDLRNAGMVKNASWAVCASVLDVKKLVE